MKVYVRKIDNQCVEKQISVLKSVVEDFFGNNLIVENDESVPGGKILKFIGIDIPTKIEKYVRILPQTDPRFSSGDLKNLLSEKYEEGDLLVFYKVNKKYEIEIIKPSDLRFESLLKMCERDDRHTLFEIESTVTSTSNRKEEYRNWLISKGEHEETTIKNYVRYISYIHEKGYCDVDLYTTDDLDLIESLIYKFKNDQNYIDYNDQNNRNPYYALLQYKEFIKIKNEHKIDDNGRLEGAYNKIYYGIPGSGKSYTVDAKFNEEEYKVFRTTFHPEYTNSDFVGQIIPMVKDDKVKYEFHPGSFTLALKYALENKNKKVCLIIEEINRGNASAIFGDIFQLLDRTEKGRSKYEIYNGPILDYFEENGINMNKIYVPSNMWIISTMNTSDQNVFTLDTAFKRRWKMEYIKNVFADNEKSKELRNKVIPLGEKYPNVTWEKFVNKINKHIISDTSGINGEDKQLGMYFVSVEEINDPKEFAEKILSYLWEDVAKLNTSYWFGSISSYDELIDSFNKNSLDIFNSLFDDEIKVTEEYTIKTVGE